MKINNKVEPFTIFTEKEFSNWVSILREWYPEYKKDITNSNAPIPLPNPVTFDVYGTGKNTNYEIRETRNLFIINTEEQLEKLEKLINHYQTVVIDTEFKCTIWSKAGFDVFTKEFILAGICIGFDPFVGYYIPINHFPPKKIPSLFEDPLPDTPSISIDLVAKVFNRVDWSTKTVVGHNAKIDQHCLFRAGIKIPFTYDTRVDCRVVENRANAGLKQTTKRIFGYDPIELSEVWKGKHESEKNFTLMHPVFAQAYAACDPINTYRALIYTNAALNVYESKYKTPSPKNIAREIEAPLLPELAEMESIGVDINVEYLVELRDKMNIEMAEKILELHRIAELETNIDFNSPEAASSVLFDMMRIPKGEDGSLKINEDVRQEVTNKLDIRLAKATADQAELASVISKDTSANHSKAIKVAVEVYHRMVTREAALPWVTLPQKLNSHHINKVHQAVSEEIEHINKQKKALKLYGEYSKIRKTRDTFTTSIIDKVNASIDKLYRTSFNQVLNSGRMSTSPNLQNMPRDHSKYDIRKAFRAAPGHVFVSADWNSMEMVMTAALSKCPYLSSIVAGTRKDLQGNPIDIHSWTAAAVRKTDKQTLDESYIEFIKLKKDNPDFYKEFRTDVKTAGFAILYGSAANGLSSLLECSVAKAQSIIDGFKVAYPGVSKWMDSIEPIVATKNYISTPQGRFRFSICTPTEDSGLFKYGLKALQNHVIQGGSADIAKQTIIKINRAFKEFGLKSRLVLMIHDELIAHCPINEARKVAKIIEFYMNMDVGGIMLTAEAEAKTTLSKSSIDLFKPTQEVKEFVLDERGEKVYKDGNPVMELRKVPTPDHIPDETDLTGFGPLRNYKIAAYQIDDKTKLLDCTLNQALEPLSTYLSNSNPLRYSLDEKPDWDSQEETPTPLL